MSKVLLQIDSSARFEGSESRQLSAQFVESWLSSHPEYQLQVRDIVSTPLPHLDEAMLGAMAGAPDLHDSETARISQRINSLVDEFMAADAIVIGVPMYNLGIPSTLKAYIDHIVMAGRTFAYTDSGAVGLVEDKPVFILTARGGIHANRPTDQQEPYLKAVLNFLGIRDVRFIHSEGLNMGAGPRNQAIAQTKTVIKSMVA